MPARIPIQAAACALASLASADPVDSPETFALLLSGGGNPGMNYHSHLVHLRSTVDMLRARGVKKERIAVFAADGADPAPDLKVRDEGIEEEAWVLEGTRVWDALRPRTRFVDAKLDGIALRPATRAALREWFSETVPALGEGDTLLLYVTDHGTENKADRRDNHIVLWGKDERISVSELGDLLDLLGPGVRVVSLMSQCYSGAFARLMYGNRGRVPDGTYCGFYSTTEDRKAYGCYPDVSEAEGIGHSHEMMQALRGHADLAAAHAQVTIRDGTPDVPLSTSDRLFQDRIAAQARADQRDQDAVAEEWLARAWLRKADFEPEIRRLDAIARRFGTSSPRSFAELASDGKTLKEVHDRLEDYAGLWVATLDSTRDEALGRLVLANAAWKERLAPDALARLSDPERRATRKAVAQALIAHARREQDTWARLQELRRRARVAREARYRLEVRLAALLRMRQVLQRAAGGALLQERADERDRAALDALTACERSMPPVGPFKPTPLTDPAPFPPFEADREVLAAIWPTWLGISYRPPTEAMRKRWNLPSGGAFVDQVLPDSPAEEAGVRPGDIVLGPKGGAPFTEKDAVREWVMLAPPGKSQALELLREGSPVEVAIQLRPHPGELPRLPGPPPVGGPAPTLSLTTVRGTVPSSDIKKPLLLFYWATWCKPCKQSVPDLLRLAKKRDLTVVAITDEPADTVGEFLRRYKEPFPQIVAIDEMRGSFRAHGVSGTPTFVLIDAKGHIAARKVGYQAGNELLD